MVEGVYNISNVFAHITVDIVGLAKKLRRLVGEIGCYHLID